MDSKKPHGRQEVMAAIVQAATREFASRGVAQVSLRDIAARAGVNHGLIHRFFGSKDNLRRAVQEHLAEAVRADLPVSSDPQQAVTEGLRGLRRHQDYWRVLAWTFLDGQFSGEVQQAFPLVRQMVEQVRQAQAEGLLPGQADPRLITAGGLAMVLGLLLFEPYILQGTGLDAQRPADTQEKILAAWISLLRP